MRPHDAGRRHLLRRILAVGGSTAALAALSPLPAVAGGDPAMPRPLDEYVPDLGGPSVASAIQAAIDEAAAAGGGTVVLPAGDLLLDHDIDLLSQVTLRGVSWSGTNLTGQGAGVLVADGAEGAGLEQLTVPTVRFGESASFTVLRQVRVRDAEGHAIVLPTRQAHHVLVEQVVIERCGGDGVRHTAGDSQGVFISEVAVEGFGLDADGACALRLGARALVSQIHVEPVDAGQTGVAFEPGSELSALTNYTMRVNGGRPVSITPESLQVAIGQGAVA